VLVAIQRAAEQKLRAGVAVGVTVLVRLALGAKSEDVIYKAACAILDRGGMPLIKTTETHHLFTDNRSEAELIEHVKRLAAELKVALPAGLIEAEVEPGENGIADTASAETDHPSHDGTNVQIHIPSAPRRRR